MHLIIILRSEKKRVKNDDELREEEEEKKNRNVFQDKIHLDFRFGSSHVAFKNYECQPDKIKICYFYTLNR